MVHETEFLTDLHNFLLHEKDLFSVFFFLDYPQKVALIKLNVRNSWAERYITVMMLTKIFCFFLSDLQTCTDIYHEMCLFLWTFNLLLSSLCYGVKLVEKLFSLFTTETNYLTVFSIFGGNLLTSIAIGVWLAREDAFVCRI